MPHRRTNTLLRLTPCRNADKGFLLRSRLPDKAEGAELFRVGSIGAAKGTLELLRTLGRDCRMIAPGMPPTDLARTEAWFATAERPSLVAVEPLLPMREDVRALYVMNLPASLEDAAACLSAVGRDGLSATAEFFASSLDARRRREAADAGDAGSRSDLLRRIAESVGWLENDGCARVYLTKRLLGLDSGVCGNCSWCLGRRGGGILPEDLLGG